MTAADPFDRLPVAIRRRLDAFSGEVDRIALEDLPPFASRPLGPEHERAADNAHRVEVETGRQTAMATARRIALEYIERRYAEAGYWPSLGIVPGPFLHDGTDRANLANSFAEAVGAIVLADVLHEDDVDELLGPWALLAS